MVLDLWQFIMKFYGQEGLTWINKFVFGSAMTNKNKSVACCSSEKVWKKSNFGHLFLYSALELFINNCITTKWIIVIKYNIRTNEIVFCFFVSIRCEISSFPIGYFAMHLTNLFCFLVWFLFWITVRF